ncbi:MAG: hypothetical protein M1834_007010 [Cirrosporium novae-zelandiae]|nr:MAG: hypothetical protein M1834_007010 [Cirrosporium novae-zelandiae]
MPPDTHTVGEKSPSPLNQSLANSIVIDFDDPKDFPDGGWEAWGVALGAWCALVPTFGLLNTIGILQAWLSTHQLEGSSEARVGWIFSIFTFFFYFGGVQVGPIFDAYGLKYVIIPGCIGLVASIMILSVAQEYYQFILGFGILGGISASMIFTPSVAAVGHWFLKRRALATGLAATAGSFGGIIFPVLVLMLAPKIGFGWAIRAMGLICAVFCILAVVLLKTRLPPNTKGGATIDLSALKDARFAFTTMGIFLVELAIFVPITYLTSYGLSKNMGERLAYLLIAILSGGSVLGRSIPGYIADRWGRFNVMIITTFACAALMLILWLMAGANLVAIIMFAVLFGFWSGSGISLTPVCVAQICKTEDYGKRYGTTYVIIKPLSPLRSSDRRRVADQIIADFTIDVPSPAPAEPTGDPTTNAPPAITISTIRNQLLPDSSLSARFTTTAGPDLKQVSGTIYVGAHPGEEQRVLWVKINERIYPTVYTLWHNPRLVPLLFTPSFVMQKLHGGADLMTPGLAGPPFPETAKKGATVAVATIENPSVPLFVGTCEIDISSLQNVRGAKGRAVRGVHWEGDELWSWSSSGKPGGVVPDSLEGWLPSESNQVMEDIQKLQITDEEEEQDGGVSLNVGATSTGKQVTHEAHDDIAETVEIEPLSTKEIDDIFHKAFLYSIHQAKTSHPTQQNHGIDFPIPQSLFISNFVMPFLPAIHPSQLSSLHIKKTSWKNAKKFIKHLDKNKLIKSKDRGGEAVIIDIDFEDSEIKDFTPYRLPKKETRGADEGGGKGSSARSPGADISVGQQLKKLNLYRPKEKLSSLFKAAKADPKAYYLASEIRPVVTTYFESENLVSLSNKRYIKIDPIFANAVFDGSSAMDNDIISRGLVTRDTLVDRVLQHCNSFYAILRNDETLESTKPKPGHGPKVQILLETRSGNKTVTKVSGLEVFYISPATLSEELQKSCASSTSVSQLVGSSPKNPVMEVMVQGPQKANVLSALEKRGVRKEWVDVVDKTKGKKGR